MPYLETVQEFLNDDTPLSANLVLFWDELEPTCGQLAT